MKTTKAASLARREQNRRANLVDGFIKTRYAFEGDGNVKGIQAFADWVGVNASTVYRWRVQQTPVPKMVIVLIELAIEHAVFFPDEKSA